MNANLSSEGGIAYGTLAAAGPTDGLKQSVRAPRSKGVLFCRLHPVPFAD